MFVAVTMAPVMTPPDGSVTVPVSAPVDAFCAIADCAPVINSAATSSAKTNLQIDFMIPPGLKPVSGRAASLKFSGNRGRARVQTGYPGAHQEAHIRKSKMSQSTHDPNPHREYPP